jgi:hypothetical protein
MGSSPITCMINTLFAFFSSFFIKKQRFTNHAPGKKADIWELAVNKLSA